MFVLSHVNEVVLLKNVLIVAMVAAFLSLFVFSRPFDITFYPNLKFYYLLVAWYKIIHSSLLLLKISSVTVLTSVKTFILENEGLKFAFDLSIIRA